MKLDNKLTYTALDAASQSTEPEAKTNRSAQKMLLILSLILTALGLAALFFPVAVGTGFAYLATVGLSLYGLSQISSYFREAKELRNGWVLANGVLLLIFSGATLTGAFLSELGVLQMIATLSLLLGFFAALIGLRQITSVFPGKERTSSRLWPILGGSLNLLLSLFLCIRPIASWFALTTVMGIYLVATSTVLLFIAWSLHRGTRG